MVPQSIKWQDFTAFLRAIRTRYGFTQDALARALGCERVHVWRLEHGKRRPSILLLRQLATSLPLTEAEKGVLRQYESLRRSQWVGRDIEVGK